MLGKRLFRFAFYSLACAAIWPSIGRPDTIITTMPSWNGSSAVSSWGIVNSATYGQTITAPADHYLTSFSFQLAVPSGIPFTANVFAWDSVSNQPTGTSLFTSPTMTTIGPVNAFSTYTINTPSVNLTTGSQYVLFFTTSGLQDNQPPQDGAWGQPQNQNVYNGGGFVFLDNGNDPTQLTTSPWSVNALRAGSDLAFTANFASLPTGNPAAIPEPASIAIFGLALFGSAIYRLRRRASVA